MDAIVEPDQWRTADGRPPADWTGSSPLHGKRLTFGKATARELASKVLGEGLERKALAPSDSAVVGQEFVADPVALGRPVNSLLSVLTIKRHATPQFAYLRQTTRTNNAAVVAEGAVKPTSVYSVERIAEELRVIAHLSEGAPRYWFLDNSGIQQFLTNELQYGLEVAVEAKTSADIDGTAGIQTNIYATSPLVTLRKSLTKVETSGYTPYALVLHPQDWEAVEVAVSSQNAVEHMSLPFDPVARRLYGVPVGTTNAQTVSVAHTLADGAVEINVDNQGVQLQWSETSNTDDWAKNLMRARLEGRFATSVYSPLGVVKSDLTP